MLALLFFAIQVGIAKFDRFSHDQVHMIKWLHHQQAEIDDQYGSNDFHRVKYIYYNDQLK